jgi:hypothetical protein
MHPLLLIYIGYFHIGSIMNLSNIDNYDYIQWRPVVDRVFSCE